MMMMMSFRSIGNNGSVNETEKADLYAPQHQFHQTSYESKQLDFYRLRSSSRQPLPSYLHILLPAQNEPALRRRPVSLYMIMIIMDVVVIVCQQVTDESKRRLMNHQRAKGTNGYSYRHKTQCIQKS